MLSDEEYMPGFYRYSGGAQSMIFLRQPTGKWKVLHNNGHYADCEWGYIEQALGVWDLVRIESDPEPVEDVKEPDTEAAIAETETMDLGDIQDESRRNWVIEKMLDRGALQEFNHIDQLITWADRMENYIKSGKVEA